MEHKPKKYRETMQLIKSVFINAKEKNTETFHSTCVAFVYFIIRILHRKHSHCFMTKTSSPISSLPVFYYINNCSVKNDHSELKYSHDHLFE